VERLATVESVLLDVRDDVRDIRGEIKLNRERIASLEGVASSFLNWQQDAREGERKQYQRLGFRIQILTVIVGLAAVVSPVVAVLLVGK
jgi:hypothetical protein